MVTVLKTPVREKISYNTKTHKGKHLKKKIEITLCKMKSAYQFPKMNHKKPCYCSASFLFRLVIMDCNEKLFPERWFEKSNFPKQTIHIMPALAEI